MVEWFRKSQPDYITQYIYLWIAFNAYYRLPDQTDREAIEAIKLLSPNPIGSGVISTKTIGLIYTELKSHPLQNLTRHSRWDGMLATVNDWTSLVEFWYTMRNNVMHGAKRSESARDLMLIELAYESLTPWMSQLVNEMGKILTVEDAKELTRLREYAELKKQQFVSSNLAANDATYVRLQQDYMDSQGAYLQASSKFFRESNF